MIVALVFAVACAGALLGIAAGYWLPPHGRLPARNRLQPDRRILLPFTGQEISRRSFEAALRLANAEEATIMPVFLALSRWTCRWRPALAGAVRAGHAAARGDRAARIRTGVPVDSRIGRGRSVRHALGMLIQHEHFDRIIVSADEDPRLGLSYDDLRWLLERVPAEILILRPAPEDTNRISVGAVEGHF